MNVRRSPLVVLALALLAGCAMHPKPYVAASKVTLSGSAALQQASHVADAAYEQRAVTQFTGRDLNQTRAILLPLALTTRAAEDGLIAWPVDEKMAPPELQKLVDALAAAAAKLTEALPESPTRVAIVGFVELARISVQAILDAYRAGGGADAAALLQMMEVQS